MHPRSTHCAFLRKLSLATLSVAVGACADAPADGGFAEAGVLDDAAAPLQTLEAGHPLVPVSPPSDAQARAPGNSTDNQGIADASDPLTMGDRASDSQPASDADLPTAVVADAPPDIGSAGDGDAAASIPGADAPADATSPAAPSPGDLIITEVMFYPSGIEPESEWFEVYNATDAPLVLSGLTIRDGYPRTHVVAPDPPVVAPPRAYVLFVRDASYAVANLLPAVSIVYEYGTGLSSDQGIQLQNDVTGDVSLWAGTEMLVDVPYGPWGDASLGQSLELASLQYSPRDVAAAWCVAQNPWASSADDGTPGGASDCP